jgi:hypothetical protein
MPAEVKDLLLTVCFTRVQDAIVEKPTKRNGEDCTKLECPLLFLLKEVKAELHELAEKLDADCHYAPESHWSVAVSFWCQLPSPLLTHEVLDSQDSRG